LQPPKLLPAVGLFRIEEGCNQQASVGERNNGIRIDTIREYCATNPLDARSPLADDDSEDFNCLRTPVVEYIRYMTRARFFLYSIHAIRNERTLGD
jgi:hypothetical protein